MTSTPLSSILFLGHAGDIGIFVAVAMAGDGVPVVGRSIPPLDLIRDADRPTGSKRRGGGVRGDQEAGRQPRNLCQRPVDDSERM